MCIEMANDLAKLLDVKLEYTNRPTAIRSSICSSNKIDLGFASIRPQRGWWWIFGHRLSRIPSAHAEERPGARAGPTSTSRVRIAVDVGSQQRDSARRSPNATIKSIEVARRGDAGDGLGAVDWSSRAVLGLTAISKNPNLGSYTDPADALRRILSMAVRARGRQALARLPVGVGRLQSRHRQMREWFVKGLSLAGVKPEDVPVELNI